MSYQGSSNGTTDGTGQNSSRDPHVPGRDGTTRNVAGTGRDGTTSKFFGPGRDGTTPKFSGTGRDDFKIRRDGTGTGRFPYDTNWNCLEEKIMIDFKLYNLTYVRPKGGSIFFFLNFGRDYRKFRQKNMPPPLRVHVSQVRFDCLIPPWIRNILTFWKNILIPLQ